MTVFTIDIENNISAFPNAEQVEGAAGAGVQTFASQKELAKLAADWPLARLVETWNGFAGVAPFDRLKPVKRFTDRNISVTRIWQAIQKLAPGAEAATVPPQGTDGAPSPDASTKPPLRNRGGLRRPKLPSAPNRSRTSNATRRRARGARRLRFWLSSSGPREPPSPRFGKPPDGKPTVCAGSSAAWWGRKWD